MPNRAIVAIFANETSAFEAANAIRDLNDSPADFSAKAGVMIQKDDRGNLSFPERHERPLWGTLGGTVIGGLVGALAGPAGSVLGAALGATTGLIGDAVTDDIGQDFVARVATDLYPGEAALIFEANEESTRYVDDIVRDMGGRIHRGDLG